MLKSGESYFNTFVCGGDMRLGWVRVIHIWFGVTLRRVIGSQVFQLRSNFLEVILLLRNGGYC